MNYAYMISDTMDEEIAKRLFSSLVKRNKCSILFNGVDLSEDHKSFAQFWANGKIEFFDVSPEDWVGRRMFCKVERLRSMPFQDGDKVFVLDTDLYFQGDIFSALEGADLFLTERHYEYWYVVNGGVWGFVYGDKIKRFLDFFVEQIQTSTWKPYVAFKEKWQHPPDEVNNGPLDWWCDQDFLCCVHDHKLPFDCRVKSLTAHYNYCPSVEYNDPKSFERSKKDILSRVGDTCYKILHFKGKLKEVLVQKVRV